MLYIHTKFISCLYICTNSINLGSNIFHNNFFQMSSTAITRIIEIFAVIILRCTFLEISFMLGTFTNYTMSGLLIVIMTGSYFDSCSIKTYFMDLNNYRCAFDCVLSIHIFHTRNIIIIIIIIIITTTTTTTITTTKLMNS